MKDEKPTEAEQQIEIEQNSTTSSSPAETVTIISTEPPPYETVQADVKVAVEEQSASKVAPTGSPVGFHFGQMPIQCRCPNCEQSILTHVEESSGLFAWLACLVLVSLGCWLGCCLIPFCIKELKTKVHYCPNCRAELGRWKFL
ncbi:unnamed protein product [Adineta ricciae]|uniref:LITAF domain-containing protein n=1 Tax=Adineta ricciae TaxID=249248 RepID=A0A814KX07_ADIRI|nr:unnamed protein product [Adineta ricciae]CAF1058125.1 unnamed protein product [Adineta ricciae]